MVPPGRVRRPRGEDHRRPRAMLPRPHLRIRREPRQRTQTPSSRRRSKRRNTHRDDQKSSVRTPTRAVLGGDPPPSSTSPAAAAASRRRRARRRDRRARPDQARIPRRPGQTRASRRRHVDATWTRTRRRPAGTNRPGKTRRGSTGAARVGARPAEGPLGSRHRRRTKPPPYLSSPRGRGTPKTRTETRTVTRGIRIGGGVGGGGARRARAVADSASLDDFGEFERHTTGFGVAYARGDGVRPGGGLGRDGRGAATPLEAKERPARRGLGAE